MTPPLQIFIGWDPREAVAYHVLCHSLMRHASCPLSITPVMQGSLRTMGLYTREPDRRASTEFSLTRFLVPYLCGYEGWALFLDCDMLCQDDISQLFAQGMASPDRALRCVQHDYVPSTTIKMDGCVQTSYPRKNWSSVMLFNTERCRALSPEYVNRATPADLHQMRWLSDEEIGAMPIEWNWLVGEYPSHPAAGLLHYTLGGPWLPGAPQGAEAKLWLGECQRAGLVMPVGVGG